MMAKHKPYPKFKDSGIDWIGEIPEGWEVNKIKNTSYVKGRIGWHGLTSEEYSDEGAYLVTGTDFKDGVIEWEDCHHVGWDRYKEDSYIHLKEDDLLITKDGTIGKVALIKILPNKATLNSGIFLVRPLNKKYIPKFMYWMLNSAVFERFFDYIKTGATISHLYQETFERFFFPIPPKQEQNTIANFLDKKTAKNDALIEKNKRLIELLKERRTALINHAVTKGLDQNVKFKDSGVEWIGEIPEGWKVRKLKTISKIVLGKMLTNDDKGNYLLKPYLRAQNIFWENVDVSDIKEMWFSPTEIKIYRLSKNDLLVSEGGEVGRTAIWSEEIDECYIQNSVHKVTILPEHNPRYLLYVFETFGLLGYFESIVNRVSIGHLTREKLKEINCIVPPLSDQTAISNFLDKNTAKIDKNIKLIEKKIKLLEEYKKSLIHHTVTGKMDVRGVEA